MTPDESFAAELQKYARDWKQNPYEVARGPALVALTNLILSRGPAVPGEDETIGLADPAFGCGYLAALHADKSLEEFLSAISDLFKDARFDHETHALLSS